MYNSLLVKDFSTSESSTFCIRMFSAKSVSHPMIGCCPIFHHNGSRSTIRRLASCSRGISLLGEPPSLRRYRCGRECEQEAQAAQPQWLSSQVLLGVLYVPDGPAGCGNSQPVHSCLCPLANVALTLNRQKQSDPSPPGSPSQSTRASQAECITAHTRQMYLQTAIEDKDLLPASEETFLSPANFFLSCLTSCCQELTFYHGFSNISAIEG